MSKVIIEKLKKIIQEAVTKIFWRSSKNSEFDLEVQDWVKKRLEKEPKKLYSFKEVKEI